MIDFNDEFIKHQQDVISSLRKENFKLKETISLHKNTDNVASWYLKIIKYVNENPTLKDEWDNFILLLKLTYPNEFKEPLNQTIWTKVITALKTKQE